jgi:hypothetical protein
MLHYQVLLVLPLFSYLACTAVSLLVFGAAPPPGGPSCLWARDKGLLVHRFIRGKCESFRDKTGSQRLFQLATDSVQLVSGRDFYKKNRTTVIGGIVGFSKFSK